MKFVQYLLDDTRRAYLGLVVYYRRGAGMQERLGFLGLREPQGGPGKPSEPIECRPSRIATLHCKNHPIMVYYFHSWVPGVEVVANFGLVLLFLGPRSRSGCPYGLLLSRLGGATFRVKSSNVRFWEITSAWQDSELRSDARALQ